MSSGRSNYRLVPVGDFLREDVETVDPRQSPEEVFELWSIPAHDKGTPEAVAGSQVGSHKKLVKPGDVLLSKIVPHIQRSRVVGRSEECRRIIASTEWIVFSGEQANPQFLREVLTSELFHRKFMETITGVGGSLARANPKAVSKIKIPLPPLAEQHKIAEILRTWDEAIETAEAELKAKQERKRWLMQKLLNPSAEGAGTVRNWSKEKLGGLGKFYSGLSGKTAADFGSGSPFISYNSVFGGSRCFIAGQPLVRIEQGERQNTVSNGDIILTGSSETADEVAMSSLYCDQDPAYLNSFCIGFSYDHKRLMPCYAEHYFRGQEFRRSVFPLAQGSTRFNISREELTKVVITLPPLTEQRKIAEVLESEDEAIESLKAKADLLRTQKRGLMQKLLTGEVRVAA